MSFGLRFRSLCEVLIAGATIALGACSSTQTQPSAATRTPQAAELPTVVVVSFDAFADRFLDRDSLPRFHRLIAGGVRAPLQPEFPSKTFPNHYSMATGLTPGQHGITTNQFFDPARGTWFLHASQNDGSWFGGVPIWVSAERAGLRTAAYFWMGSEAEIAGGRPTYWYPFDATVPDSLKVAQTMKWLRLPERERPHLVMMYSPVVDVPGHRFGPDSPQVMEGTRAADHMLAALTDSLATLSLRVDLIVVSDHGLSAVPRDHAIDMDSLIPRRGAIVDNEHATFSLWADPKNPGLNVDSLAEAYRRVLAPHVRVFRRGEFPAIWQTEQNPRFGDVFLLPDPGYEFVTTTPRALYTAGEHGYDPRDPSMMGIFVASGPDFRRGVRLPVRENRTLHDLIARLLRLDVPMDASRGVDLGLGPRTADSRLRRE
jgi:predicted AlkP superfamily pyrophosphatase or phosphodiesterase